MSELAEIARIVADCERYWHEARVPRRAVAEMRLELEQHLNEAVAAGSPPAVVVGADLAGFAEAWASEYRNDNVSWNEVADGSLARKRRYRRELVSYAAGGASLVAGVVAGSLLSGGGDGVDVEIWRWLWTIFAVVMAIGEIFTAGFFLLPFALGATAAAVLAWLGVNLLVQWLVFFGVSVISLAYLRRFIQHQDDADMPRVGANRWVGARGVVLEEIDPSTSSGMVRIESEEWRAMTDGEILATGTKVEVIDVRGARVVVEEVRES